MLAVCCVLSGDGIVGVALFKQSVDVLPCGERGMFIQYVCRRCENKVPRLQTLMSSCLAFTACKFPLKWTCVSQSIEKIVHNWAPNGDILGFKWSPLGLGGVVLGPRL